MTIMFLLGAGASVEAGVPGAYKMSKDILELLQGNIQYRRHARVITTVLGGLLFQQGTQGNSPFDGVNVEDLFNSVQLLASRGTIEAAPFISSWHPIVDELDRFTPSSVRGNDLVRAIYEIVIKEMTSALGSSRSTNVAKKIDDALSRQIKNQVEALVNKRSPSSSSFDTLSRAVGEYYAQEMKLWLDKVRQQRPKTDWKLDRDRATAGEKAQAHTGEGRIFRETAELMTQQLIRLTWITDHDKVAYLMPLLSVCERQKRLVVATLNYDNSIELLANSAGAVCETGIEEWSTKGIVNLPSFGLSLIKLHGSIDWKTEDGRTLPEKPMPSRSISKLDTYELENVEHQPTVIFGQRNKLTAEGPYLDLLRTFQGELLQANILVVVGYSFRDPHINVYLSQWLNQGDSNTLWIITPRPENNHDEYAQQLLALHYANPQRVRLIAAKASEGLIQVRDEVFNNASL